MKGGQEGLLACAVSYIEYGTGSQGEKKTNIISLSLDEDGIGRRK
jgi:hypothetical protein